EVIPEMIFAPPDKWGFRKANPKMLFIYDDRIYIAEKNKKLITANCFYYKDIDYIETGSLLLYSWLTISGQAAGEPASSKIEYCAVVDGLFKPVVAKIRSAMNALEQSEYVKGRLEQEEHKFNFLTRTDYKYMNFGKSSLIPGVAVKQIIYQPDIRTKYLRYFQKYVSYTHLTVLTGKELILIKDDDHLRTTHNTRYGGIWEYIPLTKVMAWELVSEAKLPENCKILRLFLAGGTSISRIFTVDRLQELNLLTQEIDKLRIPPEYKCG
ncbi:MAG: hypothetical protein ACM3X9_00390, partial [Bacillota bacterium]